MKELITEELREQYFERILSHLKNGSNRKTVDLTRSWAKIFPSKPGVYCFYENGILRYVGETGNISERMADMLNTKNHNLRRLIGEVLFSNTDGYKKANSKVSFTPEIESNLNDWMRKHLTVSYLPIHIGRKEFEDWIQDKHPEVKFLNKKRNRK